MNTDRPCLLQDGCKACLLPARLLEAEWSVAQELIGCEIFDRQMEEAVAVTLAAGVAQLAHLHRWLILVSIDEEIQAAQAERSTGGR